MAIAIYPGSFDPVTLGHLSVMRRAKKVTDKLIVLVTHNPNKETLFTTEERVNLIELSLAEMGLSGIEVSSLDGGLLVD